MLEDDAIKTDLEHFKVNLHDFIRFLTQTRSEVTKCSSCNAEQWVVHTEDKDGGQSEKLNPEDKVIVFEINIADRKAYQPSAIIHCANCGHINFVNYSVIRQWVDSNPEAQESEEEAGEANS